MTQVVAFRPRKYDPPRVVCEDYEELQDMVGDFIGAEQCDGCGNSTYRIEHREKRASAMFTGARWYVAKCAVDPTDDEEFRHTDPCGAEYRLGMWDEDQVVF